ncbi:unnamed protein product [Cylindrotheca closterium]|uniref:Disease resistance R13L4/SHOC-2-like LRR domain-containing protein n=1 Tax=Cylindrotheca closterium TaxID=2856 RepID=A0AAD2FIA0_9STRA|nr:unnamed protein product [Cylindrotheca closterium]
MSTEDNNNNESSQSESNEHSQTADSIASQTTNARRARQPRVPRRQRNNQTNTAQDEELKAQMRAARENAANAVPLINEESVTIPDETGGGVHVGDDVVVENLVSVPSISTPRRIDSVSSQTPGPRSAREPSIRSMYSEGQQYSSNGKEQNTPLTNGQQVGAVEVQERAFGHLPAWHRPPSPQAVNHNVFEETVIDLAEPFDAVASVASAEFSLSEPTGPMHNVTFGGNGSIDSNSVDVSLIPDDPLVEDTPKDSIVPRAICVFVIIVAIILGVVLGLFLKVEEEIAAKENASSMPMPTTTAPSSLPIQDCSDFGDIDPLVQMMDVDTLDQYNLLMENVVQKIMPDYTSPENALEDLCSAHHRASVWLASDELSKASSSPFQVAENRYLLAILFLSWKGDTWSEQTKWLSNTAECDWMGISCNESKQIVELDWSMFKNMTEQSLTIPSEIGLFTDLTSLKLSVNFIGSVPATIGNLTSLTTLDLSNNFQLSGTFPYDSIGRLDKLRTLSLSDLPKMETFPPPSINQLSSLEYLDVARSAPSNQNLPSEIGELVNLVVLSTRQTDANGPIPMEIFNLTNLEYLNLGNNDFFDELVSEIGLLQNLNMLILDNNAFSGQLPTEIGSLLRLATLSVEGNSFTGVLPHQIANCAYLEYLSLSRTDIEEDLPVELFSLSNLTSLHLSHLLVSGGIPLDLFTLSNLEIIDLAETAFSGNATIDLSGLESLECFDITKTGLAGTLIGSNECQLDFSTDSTMNECGALQLDTCTCCSVDQDDCSGIKFQCQQDLTLFEEIPQELKDRFM